MTKRQSLSKKKPQTKKDSKRIKKNSKAKKGAGSSGDDNFSVAKKDLVELPAIDMSAPEKVIIPQLIKMLTEVGFLQLKNVPGFDEDVLLKDTKEWHSMPLHIKK